MKNVLITNYGVTVIDYSNQQYISMNILLKFIMEKEAVNIIFSEMFISIHLRHTHLSYSQRSRAILFT